MRPAVSLAFRGNQNELFRMRHGFVQAQNFFSVRVISISLRSPVHAEHMEAVGSLFKTESFSRSASLVLMIGTVSAPMVVDDIASVGMKTLHDVHFDSGNGGIR